MNNVYFYLFFSQNQSGLSDLVIFGVTGEKTWRKKEEDSKANKYLLVPKKAEIFAHTNTQRFLPTFANLC